MAKGRLGEEYPALSWRGGRAKKGGEMKGLKKLMAVLLAIVVFGGSFSAVPTKAGSGIKPQKVRITPAVKTVSVGSRFKVKAKIAPSKADDDYLRWSIVGKKGIVRFADNDLKDDDVELAALKAGTTKLRCSIQGTSKKAYVTIKVKKPSYGIAMVGKKARTAEAGDSLELKVKRLGGTKKADLRWSIKNKSVAAFADENKAGDGMKLRALKAGTATVTCTDVKSKKKVTFTVKVTPGTSDDDYEDDDYGDDDYDGDDYDEEGYDDDDYSDDSYDGDDYDEEDE